LVGVPAKSTLVQSYTSCVMTDLVKTGGVLEIPGALDMKFKAKFEKNSTERREITKYLYYDSTRGGQGKVVTNMSTTTPNQDRRTLLFKKAMMKRIENKMV
jgi:hypothetical protein